MTTPRSYAPTGVLAELISGSKFAPQLRLVMLQGIALGGFNVIDIYGLHASLVNRIIGAQGNAMWVLTLKDAELNGQKTYWMAKTQTRRLSR